MTILPCPYCGSDGLVFGYRFRYIVCRNIKCSAIGASKDTDEEAIAAWNEVAGLRNSIKILCQDLDTARQVAAEWMRRCNQ